MPLLPLREKVAAKPTDEGFPWACRLRVTLPLNRGATPHPTSIRRPPSPARGEGDVFFAPPANLGNSQNRLRSCKIYATWQGRMTFWFGRYPCSVLVEPCL